MDESIAASVAEQNEMFATYGVHHSRLTPKGQSEVLRSVVEKLILWPDGLPPGFTRFCRRYENAKFSFTEGIDENTLYLRLLHFSSDPSEWLVVTSDGEFLIERLEFRPSGDSGTLWVEVMRVSDRKLAKLMEVWGFSTCLKNILHATRQRVESMRRAEDYASKVIEVAIARLDLTD